MSDTYRLSYARKKELFERRKRFGMLADWYGEEYAKTEISAHTSKIHLLENDIDTLLGEVTGKETGIYIDLVSNWNEFGGAISKLAVPGGFKAGVLFLEVRHSALLRELQSISEIIIPKLNERYGAGVFNEIRLTATAGKRSANHRPDTNK